MAASGRRARLERLRGVLGITAVALSAAMIAMSAVAVAGSTGVAQADPAPDLGPGSLDQTFATNGQASFVLNGVTLMADGSPAVVPSGPNAGKIVFAAHVANGGTSFRAGALNAHAVYVIRLNADGTPDLAFGGGSTPGAVATDLGLGSGFPDGPPTFTHAALAVQPDGNVVVTGAIILDNSGDTAIQVERLLGAGGALDSTFGTGGKTTIQLNPNSPNDHGDSIALLPNGKILVSAWDGIGNTAASHARFAVIQLTPGGGLDRSAFGAGKGVVETSFTNQADDTSQAVAVQPDGHIVLAGFAKVDPINNVDGIAVARYNRDGTLDTTFNHTGLVSTNFGADAGATGVVVDATGEVTVAGLAGGLAMVARYTAAGSLDPAFGTDAGLNVAGIRTFRFSQNDSHSAANGIAVDPQGRLLVSGFGAPNNSIGVARFNPAGDPTNSIYPLDHLFGYQNSGTEGFTCPTGPLATLWGSGVTIASDGRAIVLGQCVDRIQIARLNIDGLLNPRISQIDPTVPAGRKTVPLSDVTPSDATATLGDVLGGPFRGGPFRGGPFRGGPFRGGPFRGGPFRGGPFRGGPFRGGPFRGGPFRGGPFAIQGLPPLTLSQAPLVAPKAWSDIVPSTPYSNVSPTDVTVQQMFSLTDAQVTDANALAELNGLSMGDFDVSSSGLINLSLAALLLGTTTFQGGGLPSPCAFLTGQPQSCEKTPGTAAIMASSPAQLELAGDSLAQYYQSSTITLSHPASGGPEPVLGDSIILPTLLHDIQLDQTAMGGIPVSQAPAEVTCGNVCPQPADGSPATLGSVQDANEANIGDRAQVDDLFALNIAGATSFTETLLDFAGGVIPPQNLPVESADIRQIIHDAPPPAPTPPVHYGTFRIDVDLACYAVNGFRVDPLPRGDLRYVPGTATMTVDGNPVPVSVAPANNIRPSGDGIYCSSGSISRHITVTFGMEAGPVLGSAPGLGATISTGGEVLTSDAPEGRTKADFSALDQVNVVDGTEIGATPVPPVNTPNTVSAVTIAPDTLKLGHIYQPGVVQYFQVTPPPQAGTIVQVTLSHLPADYDLVVYGPPGVQLVTPEATSFSGGPFRGGPFRGGPFRGGGVQDNTNTHTASSSVTPPENVEDIPFLPNVAVRGVSANRGTQGESIQFVVQPNDPSSNPPFLIQVSGYNGAFSAQPYVVKYSVTAPAPGLPCQPRSYNGGGTAGALPTTAAGKQSLVLVDEKRIGDIYGAAAEAGTIAELNKLASNPNVNGVVVPVEGDAAAANAYGAWDGSPCSVQAANSVVSAISGVVQRLAATSTDLRWITIIGADELLPFGRIPDLGVQMNEQGYDTAAQNGKDNATSAALRAGYMLSDDPYGDFSPSPWFSGQLYLPQVAIGRLVETPANIATQIDQFVALNGRLTPNASLTAGYDFFTPVAQAVGAAVTSQTASPVAAGKATLFAPTGPPGTNTNFSQADAAGAYLATAATGGFISLNAHHDQYRAESAKDFNSPTPGADPAFTAAGLPSLRNSILFNMGCHAGLNLADVLVANPTAAQAAVLNDWPQATSSRGGVLQANTGFGEGDSAVMAYSMRLTAYFAQNLNGKMTLGQALMFAKQHYVDIGAPSVYDAKAIEQAAFYGLPQYRLGASGTAAPSALPASLPPPPTTVAASTQSVTFTNGGSTPVNLQTAPDGTKYYQVGSQYPQVTPYEPVQPRAEIPLSTPNGQVAHGAIIESLTSTDHSPFSAHFDVPMDDRTAFTPPIQPGHSAFPSALVGVDHTATPTGAADTLVVTPGQYFTTSGGAVQRVFDSVGTTIEYSNSQDFTAPTIATVNADIHGTTTAFAVTTPSAAVTRAVVLYFLKSTNTWTKVELTDTSNGVWAGVASVPAGTTTVDAYFVQLLNAAGNVGVASNKGFDYSTTSAPVSAVDFTVAISASPNARGTFPDGTAATIVPAPDSDPGLTFLTSVDGGSPVAGKGPFVLHGVGVHTVSVTDSNGLSQTVVIPIGSLSTLTANPATFKVRLLPRPAVVTFLNLSATLTDYQGHPLSGLKVTFSAGGLICSAISDSSGVASCGGALPLLAAVLNLGYTATFAGTLLLGPSTSMGPLILIT